MKNIAFEMDQKAKTLSMNYLRTEAELLSHLMEMRKSKVFALLNYSGVFDYCEKGLKLSKAQAYYFKTVAEKSESVPELKAAVVQGTLTLSQERRIAPVITAVNHVQWVNDAKTLSQSELEKKVASVNPKAHVNERIRVVDKELSELKVAIDEETENNLKALKDILSQKLGKAASLQDAIAWAAKVTREKFDPEKQAERSLKRKSISLGKQPTPQPGRHRIPASVKHQVILKKGRRCWRVDHIGRRCEQRRWLHFHHVRPVSEGGLNIVSELELRCSAHHALLHSS